MTVQANFNGRIITQPGSLSYIDATALNNPQSGQNGIVAIIGSCLSGPPKVPVLFNSPGQLQAALGSGNAYDGARMAFNPSTQLVEGNYVRPQLVYVVRADAALQSSITLNDSNAQPSVTLTSVDYGYQTNQISVLVANVAPNNANSNDVDISIRYGTSLETFTGIGYTDIFTLRYNGTCDTAVFTIDGTHAQAAIAGDGAADSFDIELSAYPTLQSLIDYVQAKSANYVITPKVVNPSGYNLVNLDYWSSVDIKATTASFYDVTNQLVNTINNSSSLVTAERVTGGSLPPAATVTYQFLTGGETNGSQTGPGTAPGLTDFEECFTALQQYRVNFVALANSVTSATSGTDGASLGSTFAAWLETMQGVNECHGHVGTYINGSPVVTPNFANLEALAKEINSVNTNLWTDAVMVPNDRGVATWYDSWMTACMAAGFQAGTPPGTSFVQKSFNILNTYHYVDPTGDDLNPYLNGDNMVLARLSFMKFNDATKSWNIVRALTTYSSDGNDYNTEPGIRSAVNYAVYSIRQHIEQKFLGARTLFTQAGSTADSAKNELLAFGRLLEDANVIVKGTALQNNQIVTLPALVVDNVSISGDILRLRYGIRPIGSINFIFHTINLNSVQQVATT